MEKKESGLPDSQKGFEEALQLIEAFKEMATKVGSPVNSCVYPYIIDSL